jgi:hypothetical protein
VTYRAAILVAGVALAASALAGCGSGEHPPATGSPTPSSQASSAVPSSPRALVGPTPTDAACASLYARLQQITAVLNSSAELIAGSVDKAQLGQRIAAEQQQLSGAAKLMARKPIPARLRGADRRLVVALRVLTGDFGRAVTPAKRGDFQTAVAAMHDDATVQRIITASKSIEDACV